MTDIIAPKDTITVGIDVGSDGMTTRCTAIMREDGTLEIVDIQQWADGEPEPPVMIAKGEG